MAVVVAAPGRRTSVIRDQVTWSPLVQQQAEPDTLLLADFTDFESIAAAGGIIAGPILQSQDVLAAGLTFGAGKFTPAVKVGSPAYNILHQAEGLIGGDEWTVECWQKHDTIAWDALTGSPVFIEIFVVGVQVVLSVNAGSVSVNCNGLGVGRSATCPPSLTAGAFHQVALVYRAGALQMILNGVAVGAPLTVALPAVPANVPSQGVNVGGSTSVPSGLWVSDLRISRTGLVPNTPVTRRTLIGDMYADTTAVGIDTPILGALHPPLETDHDADQIGAAVSIIRTAGLVTVTPNKLGAPDATRPSLGHTGVYSYDWQVLDRILTECFRLAGAVNLDMDLAPEVLGGHAALTGGALATYQPATGAPVFTTAIPNDINAWPNVVADFVWHITHEMGWEIAYWSFWNEPDLAGFWAGTHQQYLDFYSATAIAIRANDAFESPILGPDTSNFQDASIAARVEPLFAECAASGAPLDAISLHDYSGAISQYDKTTALVDVAAAAHGFPTPFPLWLGEHHWTAVNNYTPARPLAQTHMFSGSEIWHIRAFTAAYIAGWLCNALRFPSFEGYIFSHLNSYTGDPRTGGWSVDQLIGNLDEDGLAPQWAHYNVMKGMHLVLGNKRLPVTMDLPPGVFGYVGKDSVTGRVGVALASYGWSNTATRTVNVHLPGMTGSKRVRSYLMDPTHSSRWDTRPDDMTGGGEDDDLEMVSDVTMSAAAARDFTVMVPKWSATFVTVDPA